MANSAKLSLLTAVFAMTAFVLYWVGAMRCNFVKFSSTAFGTSTPITVEFGIWYYESLAAISTTDGNYIVEYCHAYPDTVEIDASWKAARAFSVLVFIFACIIVGTLLYASCFPARAGHSLGRFMPPLYLLMAIFQGLTLLFLDSAACKANPLLDGLGSIIFQDTCTISTGAKSDDDPTLSRDGRCRRPGGSRSTASSPSLAVAKGRSLLSLYRAGLV